jgi:hypothetical protein
LIALLTKKKRHTFCLPHARETYEYFAGLEISFNRHELQRKSNFPIRNVMKVFLKTELILFFSILLTDGTYALQSEPFL